MACHLEQEPIPVLTQPRPETAQRAPAAASPGLSSTPTPHTQLLPASHPLRPTVATGEMHASRADASIDPTASAVSLTEADYRKVSRDEDIGTSLPDARRDEHVQLSPPPANIRSGARAPADAEPFCPAAPEHLPLARQAAAAASDAGGDLVCARPPALPAQRSGVRRGQNENWREHRQRCRESPSPAAILIPCPPRVSPKGAEALRWIAGRVGGGDADGEGYRAVVRPRGSRRAESYRKLAGRKATASSPRCCT